MWVVKTSGIFFLEFDDEVVNSWKAVTLTCHLMIKFPTDYGVGELGKDQVATRECYIEMLEMDNHLQTMNIEEQWTVV